MLPRSFGTIVDYTSIKQAEAQAQVAVVVEAVLRLVACRRRAAGRARFRSLLAAARGLKCWRAGAP